MKLYIVEGSTGSYEDYYRIIIGIRTSPEEAGILQRKAVEALTKYKEGYSEEQVESFEIEIDDLHEKDGNYSEISYPEHLRKYLEWKWDAPNWNNDFSIKEYSVNSDEEDLKIFEV